ncbi:MAG: dephospho-CoA kinase [Bacteroidaceae bacterium]|nr:dephospho-CoA kinase [Bacteroidaceae bacterium]
MILGITGGIGSGKSLVCGLLEERGIPVFYTDDEAKLEMRENQQIHRELIDLLGPEAIDSEGAPVKAVLADYICRGQQFADNINDIVHPRVRERMQHWIKAQHKNCVAIESALLFESGFNNDCTVTITIIAPLEVRVSRIMRRDSISRDKALEWISLQMPQEQKAALADYTIVNDAITPLTPQLDKLLNISSNN